MTPQETLTLTRYVKAACPQQAMDRYTPDAWHDLLGDLLFADCREAARNVGKRQPFIAPSEIRAEVREIRAERVRNAGDLEARVPRELADKPLEYRDWLQRTTQAIADGEPAVRAIGGAA
jgi:hypothetical protein